MEEWLERLVLLAIILAVPMALILLVTVLNWGGILLLLVALAWFGTALILLAPALA